MNFFVLSKMSRDEKTGKVKSELAISETELNKRGWIENVPSTFDLKALIRIAERIIKWKPLIEREIKRRGKDKESSIVFKLHK